MERKIFTTSLIAAVVSSITLFSVITESYKHDEFELKVNNSLDGGQEIIHSRINSLEKLIIGSFGNLTTVCFSNRVKLANGTIYFVTNDGITNTITGVGGGDIKVEEKKD